jgi:two-component system, NtrC family, response regulator HydG
MIDSVYVLVVDDNLSNVRTLTDILDVKGFEVQSAESGAEALEVLREHPVDILLTDVKMPGMNGLELFRETRKLNPGLITIFMTAYSADELIQQGMAEGVKTVLDKPLEINFMLHLFSAYKKELMENQVDRFRDHED